MGLFTQPSEVEKGIRILAINVQSPPKERALRLANEISDLNPNVIVLSELSNADGSQVLLDNLYSYGRYDIFWERPEKNSYAVAVCVRGLQPLKIPTAEMEDANRIQVLRIKIAGQEICLVGVYVPALNYANIYKRSSFFSNLRSELIKLRSTNGGEIILVGDVNAISSRHVPSIYTFAQEGYPLDAIIKDLDLIDLFQTRPQNQEHTWFSPDGSSRQLLDNCFISSTLDSQIKKCEVIHSFRTGKFSDHSAILVEGFD